jgi:hypothetical protein
MVQLWLDFQHCTAGLPGLPTSSFHAQLQRERYEDDMKLIPSGVRLCRGAPGRGYRRCLPAKQAGRNPGAGRVLA